MRAHVHIITTPDEFAMNLRGEIVQYFPTELRELRNDELRRIPVCELRHNGVLRSSLNQKRSSGSHMAGPIVAVKFGGRLQVVIASYGRLGCRGTAKAPW